MESFPKGISLNFPIHLRAGPFIIAPEAQFETDLFLLWALLQFKDQLISNFSFVILPNIYYVIADEFLYNSSGHWSSLVIAYSVCKFVFQSDLMLTWLKICLLRIRKLRKNEFQMNVHFLTVVFRTSCFVWLEFCIKIDPIFPLHQALNFIERSNKPSCIISHGTMREACKTFVFQGGSQDGCRFAHARPELTDQISNPAKMAKGP